MTQMHPKTRKAVAALRADGKSVIVIVEIPVVLIIPVISHISFVFFEKK